MSTAVSQLLIFTPSQVRALLHRLDLGDVFAEVFADTDGLEHLAGDAEARARSMSRELTFGGTLVSDPSSELDREILCECIAGSTWFAVHDNADTSPQARASAARALSGAAAQISVFYGCEPPDVPEG